MVWFCFVHHIDPKRVSETTISRKTPFTVPADASFVRIDCEFLGSLLSKLTFFKGSWISGLKCECSTRFLFVSASFKKQKANKVVKTKGVFRNGEKVFQLEFSCSLASKKPKNRLDIGRYN